METDIVVYNLAYRKLDQAFKKVTAYLTAGGALCRDNLFDMGLAETKKCPFLRLHHTNDGPHPFLLHTPCTHGSKSVARR